MDASTPPQPVEPLTHAETRRIIMSMMMPVFMGSLDQTILASALPAIGREFGDLHTLPWLITAYLIAMTAATPLYGKFSDIHGRRVTVLVAVLVYMTGSLVCATAPNMLVLILGRVLHGLGGGGLTVALYVIVARVIPAALQPSLFAGFAAAWVVPSLVGPFISGVVADSVGWEWVFLGVVGLVVPALAMVVPSLRRMNLDSAEQRPPWRISRIAWATLAGVAVLVLNLSTEATGWAGWLLPLAAVVVIAVAVRPMVPRGTLRAARGLPATVLTRATLSGAFFGAQVYLPLLLTGEPYVLSTAMAGLVLTLSGVAWAIASQVQGRNAERLSHEACLRIGLSLLGAAIAGSLLATVLGLPPYVFMITWAFAGAGMGIMYPRTTVMGLQSSNLENQGFISSAMTVADALGAAVTIALSAIVFAMLLPLGAVTAVAGGITVALAVWAVGLFTGLRAHVEAPEAAAVEID